MARWPRRALHCACAIAALCVLRVAANDEAVAGLVEELLPHVGTYSRLVDAAAEQSTGIDEFEQTAIEDRLVNAQAHFDEAAAEIITGEDRILEKIARAEEAMRELMEATREETSSGLSGWWLPSILLGAGVAAVAIVSVLTQRGVLRATAVPVLGGFSPQSGKHSSKKAW